MTKEHCTTNYTKYCNEYIIFGNEHYEKCQTCGILILIALVNYMMSMASNYSYFKRVENKRYMAQVRRRNDYYDSDESNETNDNREKIDFDKPPPNMPLKMVTERPAEPEEVSPQVRFFIFNIFKI